MRCLRKILGMKKRITMNKFVAFLVMLLFSETVYSQNTYTIVVKDSAGKFGISGAIITISGTKAGASTDSLGNASLYVEKLPAQLNIRMIGYISRFIELKNSTNKNLIILLNDDAQSLNEVTVSTTRTNARIEDLPMKVEVLGQEEMDEESSIVPGGIGSILGDLSVITVQKTNAVNGNDAIRMQGIDSKYTLLLRDGIPLYEGFSGSLGVLSIPPLDLKQVEIIKGSSSTLYGGGAIGGLINFISKEPVDSPSVTLTYSHSNLNENNLNVFGGRMYNKKGFTIFTGANIKKAKDINKDEYAEIPADKNFTFHPRFFYKDNNSIKADAGVTINRDERRSGTIAAINKDSKSLSDYLQTESAMRVSGDMHFDYKINETQSISLKGAASSFKREYHSPVSQFKGKQLLTYTELNYLVEKGRNTWISGINYNFDQFEKSIDDSILFPNNYYNTVGVYSQETFKINDKLSFETGIRLDKHSRFGYILMPSEGIFYKPSQNISIRLHYGRGYKTPSNFDVANADQLKMTSAIGKEIKSELSNGLNMDISYHALIGNKLSFQIDQAFYYTGIENATYLKENYNGINHLLNSDNKIRSIGTDTYIRLSIEDWELYLGYNHTKAIEMADSININVAYNPNDKFATTLAYEIEKKWRMGIEASFNANQYNSTGKKVSNYWFMAAMVERKIKNVSIILNCENLNNFRQSSKEDLITTVNGQPVFTELWGPTEGRIINLAIKLTL